MKLQWLFVLGMLSLAGCEADPATVEKRQAASVIDECKRQMNDTLLPASTREAYRGMCNGLRNTYVTKYGSEP